MSAYPIKPHWTNIQKNKIWGIQKRPGRIIFFAIFTSLLLISWTNYTKAQNPGTIFLISQSEHGNVGDDDSDLPTISSDGRFIVFRSKADNMVNNLDHPNYDLFIHDRVKGLTSRLAVDVNDVDLSPDGRFITYKNEFNPYVIFVHDRLNQDLSALSLNSPIQPTQYPYNVTGISNNAHFVVLSPETNRISDEASEILNNVLLHDRLTNYRHIIDGNGSKTIHPNQRPLSAISNDGRFLAFVSSITPDSHGKFSPTVAFYERVLGEVTFLHNPITESNSKIVIQDLDLSTRGDLVVYALVEENETGAVYWVLVHDREETATKEIFNFTSTLETNPIQQLRISLSGNGRYLAVISPSEDETLRISRYNLSNGERVVIDQGRLGFSVDITEDGSKIVYTKEINGISQVYLWDEAAKLRPTYILTGQVTDKTGYPLGLVTIKDSRGKKTTTDKDGFFWLSGVQPGTLSINASKDGFSFSPKSLEIHADGDIEGLKFIYTHEGVLEEAQKDLGMPYSKNRGEDGPFHGYSAGYCTDLILDAYTWGVNYNIQFALEMDFKAHPWHFYRWRDARDAHDMWRYFSYTGQIQPHENPYQPGDIVFFDWSQDGEIDHVAVISETDRGNRPKMMYDATGVINSNPGGLAAELPWEDFHESTVRGFGRWSGIFEPIIPELPTTQVLQFAFSGKGFTARLIDSKGDAISAWEKNIQGGRFEDLKWEKTFSVIDQSKDNEFYLLVISNSSTENIPYVLIGQVIQDGMVNGRYEHKAVLKPGEIARFPIFYQPNESRDSTIQIKQLNRRIDGDLDNLKGENP